METIIETRGKLIYKGEIYSAAEHQFFRRFQRFYDFLKWKQLFRIVETHFQQIFYLASGNGFSV